MHYDRKAVARLPECHNSFNSQTRSKLYAAARRHLYACSNRAGIKSCSKQSTITYDCARCTGIQCKDQIHRSARSGNFRLDEN